MIALFLLMLALLVGALWFAIGGLLVSLASSTMADQMIGDVVLWAGGVFAVISLVYYFFQPRHGLPGGRR